MGASGAHRELEPGRQVGDLGHLPRARATGAHDVRPDDRGVVDLHRDPGHPAGHLRDVRRGGSPALRRLAAGDRDADRRSGRDGRRPAAGRDDERGRVPGHRGRRGASAASPRDRVRGPAHARPRGGPRLGARRGRGGRTPPRSRWSATRRRSSPRGRRPANDSTSSPTRPARTTRSPGTCPPR